MISDWLDQPCIASFPIRFVKTELGRHERLYQCFHEGLSSRNLKGFYCPFACRRSFRERRTFFCMLHTCLIILLLIEWFL